VVAGRAGGEGIDRSHENDLPKRRWTKSSLPGDLCPRDPARGISPAKAARGLLELSAG
jgi:hypothetical protein